MINMKPVNEGYPAYIYFDINNETKTSFSGSFYVSFDSELFDSNEEILLCKIGTKTTATDIIIYLKKYENDFYINVSGSPTEVKINNFISNNGKILSFLVLFKYQQDILTIGINDKDDIINKSTSIIVKSLIFGSNIGKYTEFKTKIVEDVLYNCHIGGIRFYNELNSFTQLRNSAYFKAPPVPVSETTKPLITKQDGTPIKEAAVERTTTTTTKPPFEVLTIQQADLSENFTNYSPSAQLFKNI